MDVIESKAAWRERKSAWRSATARAQREAAAAAVAARVLTLAELAGPAEVLAYAAAGSELPTAGLIDALLAAGHAVAVPAITGERSMRGRRLGRGGVRGLTRGPLGVPAPPASHPGDAAAWMDDPAVVLVPGLAFDPRSGARLGRGGGFYDAWLATHPGAFSVGLAMEGQVEAGVPAEPHDRPVETLVTPAATRRFRH